MADKTLDHLLDALHEVEAPVYTYLATLSCADLDALRGTIDAAREELRDDPDLEYTSWMHKELDELRTGCVRAMYAHLYANDPATLRDVLRRRLASGME